MVKAAEVAAVYFASNARRRQRAAARFRAAVRGVARMQRELRYQTNIRRAFNLERFARPRDMPMSEFLRWRDRNRTLEIAENNRTIGYWDRARYHARRFYRQNPY